jgi:hypothetical protein
MRKKPVMKSSKILPRVHNHRVKNETTEEHIDRDNNHKNIGKGISEVDIEVVCEGI